MLREELKKHTGYAGYIFDGYPRTTAQAQSLDTILKEDLNQEVSVCLSLRVEDEILVQRLLARGLESGRADDANEEVIRERIVEYYKKTDEVAKHYQAQGKLVDVNGVGEISEITEKLCKEIEKFV